MKLTIGRRGRRRALGTLVVVTVLATGGSIAMPSAQAATTVAGDAASIAYTDEAVRAMAWNICGEAGGAYPGALAATGSSAFCPDRNQPAVKASTIAATAIGHNLNAIMVEEVCGGPAGNLPPDSELADIVGALGAGWQYAWAPALRPGDAPNAVGGSACRGGLTGTIGVAVIVKGVVVSGPGQYQSLPDPEPAKHQQEPIVCATVAGWTNAICAVHMVNESYTSETTSPTDYDKEVTAVVSYLSKFGSVVLGGDFNTSNRTVLAPLYAAYAECDQQAYFPGDASNEVTHFSYHPRFGAGGTITDGSYTSAKIDYLFATNGFTGCTSAVGLADQASYATAVQPSCVPSASPITCMPTGISDHAPIIGSVKGGPDLLWRLNDGSGSSANDSSGNGAPGGGADGALSGAVTFSSTHGGSASFAGTTAAIATPVPVVDTTTSFTVSAWVDLSAGAPTSTIVSQDAGYGPTDTIPDNISGFALYYNSANATWRFAMPTADSASATVNEASAAAHAGTWTELTAVFDAAGGSSGAGGMTLYVNGVKAASADHTAMWPANGPFVVGRRTSAGAGTDYWHGLVQDVAAFRYPMTSAEVGSFATKLAPPTQATTVPDASGPDRPGCDLLGGYGTVADLTPRLQVTVTDPDPSKAVHADFSIWDNTHAGQPISMGDPAGVSTSVIGHGTVSIMTPQLTPGDAYGWYARTDDGTTSTTMPVCHFVAGTP